MLRISVDFQHFEHPSLLCSSFLSGRCWIRPSTAFYAGLVTPIALCILYNIALFVAVLYALVKRKKKTSAIKKSQKGKSLLAIVASLSIMLGLTWLFGFIVVINSHIAIQYTFRILNSLQGFAVFVHTILGKEAKEGIRTWTLTLTSVIGNSWNMRRTRGYSTSATHATMDNNSAPLRSKKRITSVSSLASASRDNADFIPAQSSLAEWPLSRRSSADCGTVPGYDVYPGTESVPMEELILWSQSYPAQVRDEACLGNDEPLVEVHQI